MPPARWSGAHIWSRLHEIYTYCIDILYMCKTTHKTQQQVQTTEYSTAVYVHIHIDRQSRSVEITHYSDRSLYEHRCTLWWLAMYCWLPRMYDNYMTFSFAMLTCCCCCFCSAPSFGDLAEADDLARGSLARWHVVDVLELTCFCSGWWCACAFASPRPVYYVLLHWHAISGQQHASLSCFRRTLILPVDRLVGACAYVIIHIVSVLWVVMRDTQHATAVDDVFVCVGLLRFCVWCVGIWMISSDRWQVFMFNVYSTSSFRHSFVQEIRVEIKKIWNTIWFIFSAFLPRAFRIRRRENA